MSSLNTDNVAKQPASRSWTPGKRVAIIGGGPGGISSALAFLKRGFDVRLYEKQAACKPIGGAVLLNTPVLLILRHYGFDMSLAVDGVTNVDFQNRHGMARTRQPFHSIVEARTGIKGWNYGVLRSSVIKNLLTLLPEGVIQVNYGLDHFIEDDKGVDLHFTNGEVHRTDILVGADGIRSEVSKQLFGDPQLFHTGLRLWLAYCDHFEGIPPNWGYVSHSRFHQASFFPMLHEGKPGFEWWVMERSSPTAPVPSDVKQHVTGLLEQFAFPMQEFPDRTDFDTQCFRWEIYNRPRLSTWHKGRVMCIGDAVHPVSPYAGYGMGMAIEDGYYLAKWLDGVDLRDGRAISTSYDEFETQRLEYVYHNVEFAQTLTKVFHMVPEPFATIRDWVFDYTPLLGHFLNKGYLEKAKIETGQMPELYAGTGEHLQL